MPESVAKEPQCKACKLRHNPRIDCRVAARIAQSEQIAPGKPASLHQSSPAVAKSKPVAKPSKCLPDSTQGRKEGGKAGSSAHISPAGEACAGCADLVKRVTALHDEVAALRALVSETRYSVTSGKPAKSSTARVRAFRVRKRASVPA
jgi:hypothetical protein